jgi:hypothetical protein
MTDAERQEIAHVPLGRLDKDCYSRALFLVGKIEKERPLGSREIIQLLNEFEPTNSPEVGSLVWIVGKYKEHMAVVETTQPITVTDRNGLRGEIRKNIPLTDLLFDYGGLDTPMFYLQPKRRR